MRARADRQDLMPADYGTSLALWMDNGLFGLEMMVVSSLPRGADNEGEINVKHNG